MTGFARAEKTDGKMGLVTEIRTFNNRFLDVVLRISPEFLPLEEKIKAMIHTRLSRGRIEVKMDIREKSDEPVAYEIDWPKARGFFNALGQLVGGLNLPSNIGLEHFLGVGGLIRPAEMEKDPEARWEMISGCLTDAMGCLEQMRDREGLHIYQDFERRLLFIEESMRRIRSESSELLLQYQQRLKERIALLTKGMIDIDPVRIAQEAAFLADRSDISEEIVRAESHLSQFRLLMQSDEPAGRNLNFLLQEFNREFNTMTSKAGNAKISHVIVAVKSELEKIREQVQNVE
jgi:uncharacterized protein (TIGR00255 family)